MGEPLEIVPFAPGEGRVADGLAVHRTTPGRPILPHRHAHDFHQVTLFLAGPGPVEWQFGDGRAYAVRPAAGDVVVTPALVPTLVRAEGPIESVSVRISAGRLDRVARRAGLGSARLRPAAVRRDPFAGEVARKLAERAGPGGIGGDLLAESLGTALAVHLLREYGDAGPGPPPAGPGLPGDVLRRVVEHVEAHLDGDLSLDRLAAVAGLSPHHFARRFRVSAGVAPHRYVIGRRVERARVLLLGGCPIAEAAVLVGFSSHSHLHRHVRRLLGVTPGELAGRRPR